MSRFTFYAVTVGSVCGLIGASIHHEWSKAVWIALSFCWMALYRAESDRADRLAAHVRRQGVVLDKVNAYFRRNP